MSELGCDLSFDAYFFTDKVRLLYNRELPTARIVVRNKDDLESPLVCLVSNLTQNLSNSGAEHDSLLLACYESDPHQMYAFPSLLWSCHSTWLLRSGKHGCASIDVSGECFTLLYARTDYTDRDTYSRLWHLDNSGAL